MIRKIALAVVLASGVLFASTFCEGWDAGYRAGYCYGKSYGCIGPITPICPIPNVGEDGYQDGYNRGFLAGLNKQR